jgi:hypothetical protein
VGRKKLVRCGDPTHPTATRHPSEEGNFFLKPKA